MDALSSPAWVEAHVESVLTRWTQSAGPWRCAARRYTVAEQITRQNIYDREFSEVEKNVRRSHRLRPEKTRRRLVDAFACFAVAALDLEPGSVDLLTRVFLPVGTALATWARQFDPAISYADIAQACRNAWTACGLQPLLGAGISLSPAILGYSLLYPYSDNLLDQPDVRSEQKLWFSHRFRCRLRGELILPCNVREAAIWALIRLIEDQFPRLHYPAVFDSLLAIHRAQEESLAQLHSREPISPDDLLRITCSKGGTSVLADACLVRGDLTPQESLFAFEWGVLLQLGDDLQDIQEDLNRGSDTLFTRAVRAGISLDALVHQLLNLSEAVGETMNRLMPGDPAFKRLLQASWRSLIIMAVAQAHTFFSPQLLAELEPCSPFRFEFLRERRERLNGKTGLFNRLLEVVLAAPATGHGQLPAPVPRQQDFDEIYLQPAIVAAT